ncbi:MAG: hypothetical protein EOO03_16515 [Chitinophagaceae bacterium]|nr:MAG: hypothetical protein EOO03_16515 [Chitinophagaceae bacterium]
MKPIKTLLCLCLIFCGLQLKAQTETPFTSLNEITLNIPGTSIQYSYFSNKLLFRFNREKAQLELRVPISSFTPANTGSPQVLLQELFLANQFPELIIVFDAPMDLLQTQDLKTQDRKMEAVVMAQGISRDIAPDVYLIPLPNQFTFSTTFNFSLFGPDIILPRTYAGMVQGPVEVIIEKARWIYELDNQR